MKLDNYYSNIYVCPTNHVQVSYNTKMYSMGVCHICGHNTNSTVTHAVSKAGKWLRPNFFEWLVGMRKEFIFKEDIK